MLKKSRHKHGIFAAVLMLEKLSEMSCKLRFTIPFSIGYFAPPQPVKINLNKKLDSKQKTIQTFNIDALGFRKTSNENFPLWEIWVTS